MPFDFFNLSNLAFGNKLTLAFTQLERLVKEDREHIDILIRDIRIYAKYLNRNYQIPAPLKGSDGCRVDELFSIISERVIVDNISYSIGELRLECIIFSPSTGIVTKLQGYTDLKEGYCYFNRASSNNSVSKPALFFSDKNTVHGIELFKFKTDSKNKTVTIDWSIK